MDQRAGNIPWPGPRGVGVERESSGDLRAKKFTGNDVDANEMASKKRALLNLSGIHAEGTARGAEITGGRDAPFHQQGTGRSFRFSVLVHVAQ